MALDENFKDKPKWLQFILPEPDFVAIQPILVDMSTSLWR